TDDHALHHLIESYVTSPSLQHSAVPWQALLFPRRSSPEFRLPLHRVWAMQKYRTLKDHAVHRPHLQLKQLIRLPSQTFGRDANCRHRTGDFRPATTNRNPWFDGQEFSSPTQMPEQALADHKK